MYCIMYMSIDILKYVWILFSPIYCISDCVEASKTHKNSLPDTKSASILNIDHSAFDED